MRKKIHSWFEQRLLQFPKEQISVWLFGSMTQGKVDPSDCDILIITSRNNVQYLLEIWDIWAYEFKRSFHLPLHLMVLTFEEIEDCNLFLKQIFSSSSEEIY